MRYFMGVITAALLIGAPAAGSAGPPQQIAYTSTTSNGSDIFLMNADGSNVQRLTSTGLDSEPTWSPDGSQIAYVSRRNGLYTELYAMNTDGTNVHRVLDMPAFDPQWSRQDRIAFVSSDIYSVAPDGSGLTQVTRSVSNIDALSWSADGSELAYGASVRNVDTIFIVNADGSNTRSIATIAETPAFSPDGKHLAWAARDSLGNATLVVANADGSSPRTIWTAGRNQTYTYELYPSWSPDSQTIVFEEGPNAELWSVPAAGGTATQLTTSSAVESHPAFRTAVPSTGLVVSKLRFTQRACATRPGAAAVTVDDAQGRPLAGVQVVFYGGRTTTTDANGAASVSPAVAKRHKGRLTLTFTARQAGRPTATKRVSLPVCH